MACMESTIENWYAMALQSFGFLKKICKESYFHQNSKSEKDSQKQMRQFVINKI